MYVYVSDESFELTPGYHVYPFSYELPQNLPSSFTGQVGSVTYYVEVIVDRPWKWDQKIKFPFILVSPYDLNMFPKLKVYITCTKVNLRVNAKPIIFTIKESGPICNGKDFLLLVLCTWSINGCNDRQ